MQIPASVTNGRYRLKLEGYDTLHPQKAVFVKESQLDFHSDFLSIVVQTNRKVFRNGMKGAPEKPNKNFEPIINKNMNYYYYFFFSVRFRVILTQLNLKPYTDPITVFIVVQH
jgi:hypothetical protein